MAKSHKANHAGTKDGEEDLACTNTAGQPKRSFARFKHVPLENSEKDLVKP